MPHCPYRRSVAPSSRLTARQLRSAIFVGALVGTLTACTSAQLDRAASYQSQIAGACAVATTLSPIAGPYAPFIVGACATEAAIARLALDPSSLDWIRDLVSKIRERRA